LGFEILSNVRNSGLNKRFNDKKIWEKDMKSKIKNQKSKIKSDPQSLRGVGPSGPEAAIPPGRRPLRAGGRNPKSEIDRGGNK